MSLLQTIVAKRKERLSAVKSVTSLTDLKSRIRDVDRPRDFTKAIKGDDGVKLIAEIKQASPSSGILRVPFHHTEIARIYEQHRVDAISVLTEEDFFRGNLSFIPDVKKVSLKPVLRKDFIIDEYQIYESRAYEADAILLIASLIEKNQAREYLHLAGELGLAVLFEIHNYRDLGKAFDVHCDIIGINNRDLETLEIDLATSTTLKREIPAEKIVVSESGIATRDDVQKLEAIGIDALLIGTVFMKAEDIGRKIDELMGRR